MHKILERSSAATPSAPIRGNLRAAWLGTSFLLMHIAFNVAQARVTTLYPSEGFISLALLYFGLAIGALSASVVIRKYITSPRWIFFIGGASYSMFAVGANLGAVALMITSFIAGVSGGIMWCQLCMYLARMAEIGGGDIGRLTTIFYGLSAFNMVVGNFISLKLGFDGFSTRTILWIVAAIGSSSCLCFLFVGDLPAATPLNSTASLDSTQSTDAIAVLSLPQKFIKVWTASPMKELTPLLMFSGTFNTLVLGSLPLYLPRTASNSTNPSDLALLFMAYGACAGLCAPVFGQVFDRGGPRALSAVFAIIASTAYALLLCVLVPGPGAYPDIPGLQKMLLLVVAGMFGALDTCTSALINACVSTYVKPHFSGSDAAMSTGFSIVRIAYCIAFVTLSIMGAILPSGTSYIAWVPILALNLIVLSATIVCMLRLTLPGGMMSGRVHKSQSEYAVMAEKPCKPTLSDLVSA